MLGALLPPLTQESFLWRHKQRKSNYRGLDTAPVLKPGLTYSGQIDKLRVYSRCVTISLSAYSLFVILTLILNQINPSGDHRKSREGFIIDYRQESRCLGKS